MKHPGYNGRSMDDVLVKRLLETLKVNDWGAGLMVS
jgi:hypothetical protein